MENEKKQQQQKKQCFYFNENGQLVVESNKGVWVDGEKFVKMYGDFTCNAKTIGVVIEHFKGIKVEADTRPEEQKFDEYINNLAKQCEIEAKEHEKQLERLRIKNENINVQIKNYRETIENFNRLPWWKRLFKKVDVK